MTVLNEPHVCIKSCWTALPCPECARMMNPYGRSAPPEITCTRESCPVNDPAVNPRHLWDKNDDDRWRAFQQNVENQPQQTATCNPTVEKVDG